MTSFATGRVLAASLFVAACGSGPSAPGEDSYSLALDEAGGVGSDASTGDAAGIVDDAAIGDDSTGDDVATCSPALDGAFAPNATRCNVSYSCAYKYTCTGGTEKIAQKTVTITPPREKCDPNALNPVRQDVQDACGGAGKVASFKCDCAELDVEDGDHCDTTSVKIP
jgi:hypothetical protein